MITFNNMIKYGTDKDKMLSNLTFLFTVTKLIMQC